MVDSALKMDIYSLQWCTDVPTLGCLTTVACPILLKQGEKGLPWEELSLQGECTKMII